MRHELAYSLGAIAFAGLVSLAAAPATASVANTADATNTANSVANIAEAESSRLALQVELGFAALTNSSTTRAPAPLLGVGARYYVTDYLALTLGYRGALRWSGNRWARVTLLVNQLPVGSVVAIVWGPTRVGMSLELVPTLETTRLSGAGASTVSTTTTGIGAAANLELGLRVHNDTFASFILGATTRRYYVDYAMLCALEWRL
jgi:hypothetical protein